MFTLQSASATDSFERQTTTELTGKLRAATHQLGCLLLRSVALFVSYLLRRTQFEEGKQLGVVPFHPFEQVENPNNLSLRPLSLLEILENPDVPFKGICCAWLRLFGNSDCCPRDN